MREPREQLGIGAVTARRQNDVLAREALDLAIRGTYFDAGDRARAVAREAGHRRFQAQIEAPRFHRLGEKAA